MTAFAPITRESATALQENILAAVSRQAKGFEVESTMTFDDKDGEIKFSITLVNAEQRENIKRFKSLMLRRLKNGTFDADEFFSRKAAPVAVETAPRTTTRRKNEESAQRVSTAAGKAPKTLKVPKSVAQPKLAKTSARDHAEVTKILANEANIVSPRVLNNLDAALAGNPSGADNTLWKYIEGTLQVSRENYEEKLEEAGVGPLHLIFAAYDIELEKWQDQISKANAIVYEGEEPEGDGDDSDEGDGDDSDEGDNTDQTDGADTEQTDGDTTEEDEELDAFVQDVTAAIAAEYPDFAAEHGEEFAAALDDEASGRFRKATKALLTEEGVKYATDNGDLPFIYILLSDLGFDFENAPESLDVYVDALGEYSPE